MVEPDNLVLTLLRELRAEMDSLRSEINARFDETDRRLGQMHANGVKALGQFVGHRSMVERTMGSFQADLRALEARVELLESARG
jgi:hypothetical protein